MACIFIVWPLISIWWISTVPATGERTPTSRASCADCSCMKAPPAFAAGTVARIHASLTLTCASAHEAADQDISKTIQCFFIELPSYAKYSRRHGGAADDYSSAPRRLFSRSACRCGVIGSACRWQLRPDLVRPPTSHALPKRACTGRLATLRLFLQGPGSRPARRADGRVGKRFGAGRYQFQQTIAHPQRQAAFQIT